MVTRTLHSIKGMHEAVQLKIFKESNFEDFKQFLQILNSFIFNVFDKNQETCDTRLQVPQPVISGNH